MSELKEFFNDFVKRLKSENRGDGVKLHGTAYPIFIVQEKEKIFGMRQEYSGEHVWIDQLSGDYLEFTDEELLGRIKEEKEEGVIFDYFNMNINDEITQLGVCAYQRIYFIEKWKYVNAHFTRDSALAFIERKKHDHGELRIWVDSQFWSDEWKIIIDAIIDGKITFND